MSSHLLVARCSPSRATHDPLPPARSARAPTPKSRLMILRPMSFRVSASDRGCSPHFFTGNGTLCVDAPPKGPQQPRHRMANPPEPPTRWIDQLQHFLQTIGPVIRIEVVCHWTGLSRSTVYERIDEKGPRWDPSFPRPFPLSGDRVHSPSQPQLETRKKSTKNKEPKYKTQAAVGWSSIEVASWIAAQAAKREGGCK